MLPWREVAFLGLGFVRRAPGLPGPGGEWYIMGYPGGGIMYCGRAYIIICCGDPAHSAVGGASRDTSYTFIT